MDIVGLIKNFLSNENVEAIVPIIELLRDNGFDLKRTLTSLTPEKLASVFEKLFQTGVNSGVNNGNVNKPFNAGGVTPIAQVADSEIVYALNRYIGAPS